MLYRLRVLTAEIPPLRQRLNDIPQLSHHLLAKSNYSIADDVWDVLQQHNWPGNVRELRNVLQRALVLSGGNIQREHIQFFTIESVASSFGYITKPDQQAEQLRLDLEEKGGNVSALAREYGIARSTLVYRLKRYNLIT